MNNANVDRTTWLGQVYVGQVEDLRDEAAVAGDMAMIAICDDALEGDRAAQTECLRVIRANNSENTSDDVEVQS
jgi:hypothetical protein